MKGPYYGPSCYRVTDSTSVSPYSEEFGFTANHTLFTDGSGRPISGRIFMSEVEKPSIDDPSLREGVVGHILGGWSVYPYHPTRRRSQWISTTADHEWAMWETARRLASGQVSWVSVAEIRTYTKHSPDYRGTQKVGLTTITWLKKQGFGDRDRCLALARSSKETLYYGRIFPKDIKHEETWVRDEHGASLPEYFFIPKKHRHSNRWIDNLVWDPNHDSFYTAEERLQERYDQIQASRR